MPGRIEDYGLIGDLLGAVEKQPQLQLLECNPVIVHTEQSGLGASVVDLLGYAKETVE